MEKKVFTIYSEAFTTALKNATSNSEVIIRRQLEAVDHPATEGGNLSTHKHLFKDSAATKQ